MINARSSDLILIGGDLLGNSVVPFMNKKMEELAELKVRILWFQEIIDTSAAHTEGVQFLEKNADVRLIETSHMPGSTPTK